MNFKKVSGSGETLRLGVNIDHVATLRNARGSFYPDPIGAALLAQRAGADGITAHLREDRRHIKEDDIKRITTDVDLPLNLEMAATEEMREIALKYKPNAICLVPENRLELTTEGGLDVKRNQSFLKKYIGPLKEIGCRISLFLAAHQDQIDAACFVGATTVELHTGFYCDLHFEKKFEDKENEFKKLREMAKYASSKGLEVHAGHGLTVGTVSEIASIRQLKELNIGHSIISDSIFFGLDASIKMIRNQMEKGRTEYRSTVSRK